MVVDILIVWVLFLRRWMVKEGWVVVQQQREEEEKEEAVLRGCWARMMEPDWSCSPCNGFLGTRIRGNSLK